MSIFDHVNIPSIPPSGPYMCHWTGLALVQVMACWLFCPKPLPKPMLPYCQWDLWEQTSWNLNQNTKYFIHENAPENVCKMAAILSRGDELKAFHTCWIWKVIVQTNTLLEITKPMPSILLFSCCKKHPPQKKQKKTKTLRHCIFNVWSFFNSLCKFCQNMSFFNQKNMTLQITWIQACELKWSGGWSTGTVGWLSASERGHDLEGWPAMNTKCLVPLTFLPDLILWSTENRSHGSPVLVPPETQ